MKTTAPLQQKAPKTSTANTAGKATLNPLQLKKEGEALQKKQNTLAAAKNNQNPLQLLREKSIQPNSRNPLQLKDNRTGLPDHLKAGVEALSGYSMDDVSVHYNSSRPAQLQALAYAQGTDIHIAPGQEKHLPHEAWHVVQQKQGRVQATVQMKGGVLVNDDKGLESEADVMGTQSVTVENTEISREEKLNHSTISLKEVIQGKWFRLSTLLTPSDESEVEQIKLRAVHGQLLEAFWMVISNNQLKNPQGLIEAFEDICDTINYNEEKKETAENILWETFYDPSKSYTAAEVIELLENHPVISDEDNFDTPQMDDLDELILQFSNLHITIPFRSDIDNKSEEHRVSWEEGDVTVASNPKPLVAIITAKKWGNYPLSAPLILQLTSLRKIAKHALYDIAGNAKRKIQGSRTKGKMNVFRNALSSIANVLSNLGGATHVATLMPATDLSSSTNHSQNNSPTEGQHVIAKPLSINSATHGSPPIDGRLMKAIRKHASGQSKSYVQMHLLNDLVFGPGQLWNLTPGPKQSNTDMEHNVEHWLKRAILDKGLVINFEAIVNYTYNPQTASNIDIDQNPDKYRFQWISFKAEQLEYHAPSTTWKISKTQDADVKKVNGAKVTWRYGSLTPLVKKPKILDPNTTLQELYAVGIQKKAALRISNFVKKHPVWVPSGKNKQQELASEVKAYDKEKTIPNISSWKSNSVLWS